MKILNKKGEIDLMWLAAGLILISSFALAFDTMWLSLTTSDERNGTNFSALSKENNYDKTIKAYTQNITGLTQNVTQDEPNPFIFGLKASAQALVLAIQSIPLYSTVSVAASRLGIPVPVWFLGLISLMGFLLLIFLILKAWTRSNF